MNRQASKTIGITLLLAAGLLVALITIVFTFSPGVGAHNCNNFPHMDSRGVPCGQSGHDTDNHPVSSTVPNEPVTIKLAVEAETEIAPGEKITVDFSGPGPSTDSWFHLPVSIANEKITIDPTPDPAVSGDSFNPLPDGLNNAGNPVYWVRDTEVVLTIPPGKSISSGSYTITFAADAGIKNSHYAGRKFITVSSNADGDEPDTIETEVSRITTITPLKGHRGRDFTLTGKGYAVGTVTIFDGDDDTVDDGEFLARVETGTGDQAGTFSVPLRDRAEPGSLSYTVRATDSEGATKDATFHIDHAMSIEPSRATVGDMPTITVKDWQDPSTGVAAVRIGGVDAFIANPIAYEGCVDYTDREMATSDDRVLTLDVEIPEGVLTGNQTVSLYDYDQLIITDTNEGMEVGDDVKDPCTGPPNWVPSGKNLRATLKSNPDPIIQETVEVISQEEAQGPGVVAPGQHSIEVDGGRDQKLDLRVYPPTEQGSINLDAGDEIEISLPEFDLSNAMFGPTRRGVIDVAGVAVSPSHIYVDDAAQKLVIRLSGSYTRGAGEFLAITIKEGSGILTPKVPRGFDDTDHRSGANEGYPVGITIDSAATGLVEAPGNNFVVVKNPVSSTVPSAPVRVTLVTHAGANIGPSEEIVVDFSGPSADSEFIVPSSISNARITIQPKGMAAFNPSGVLVQGARVTLTIPSGSFPKNVPEGEYTITFQQAAGIKNPYSAGNLVITVSSFVEGDERDEITAVIRRTTTIDPTEGPRGTEFTLTGKGYAEGTVTIFHDANYNTGDTEDEIDPGETLDSVNTVRGAFTVRLTVRGKPGDLLYRVRTRDSEGVVDRIDFTIESGIFFEPLVGRVGSPLRITISDWQDLAEEVAVVSVGGEIAYIVDVKEYANCFEYTGGIEANPDGVITLEIEEVPLNIPEGKQTVSFYGYDQLDYYLVNDDGSREKLNWKPQCDDNATQGSTGAFVHSNVEARLKDEPTAIIKETLDIDREELALSPPTAARGQKVTITGSGFSRAAWGEDHIESVWIGGKKVAEDHSWFEVGTNGDIAFAVTVPLDVSDGANEVLIQGTDSTLGESVLTVPPATISLDPPLGHRGTDLTITGSGFIANELVFVTYGAGVGAPREEAQMELLLADSRGGFELLYEVPYTAQVGKRHLITAVGEAVAEGVVLTVEAEASHLIPRANITTTPEVVSPGERLNILGQGLPSFAPVGSIMIEGIRVLGQSGIATDENGSFETDVLVPNLDFGDHSLSVQVAEVIVPHIFTVEPPPLNGSPGQVFKYLVRDGVLLVVWHYDNATQSWSVFDPSLTGEMAALNDLTEVGSSDIVWVNLRQPQFFQESELLAGWNLITLK